jgi:hypothetical protein
MKVLVVKSHFGQYAKGDVITDPDEIAEVLAGENAPNVIPAEHQE